MTTSKAIVFISNESSTDGFPCGSPDQLANNIESPSAPPSAPPSAIARTRTEVGAVWSKDKLSPNRTRKTTKDNKLCNKYQGKGRRGDPRMHAAVNARLDKPQLSLLQALIAGGFRFPDMKKIKEKRPSDDIYDEDNILLSQRKNQLSRRLRHIARKRDKLLKRFPSHYSYPGMMNDAGDGDGLCAPNSSVNMTPPPPSLAMSSHGSHLHNHTLDILLEQASRVEQELRRKHFSRQQQQQHQHHMQPPAPFSLAHHPDVKDTSISSLRSSPSSSLVEMFPQSNVLRGADNSGFNMSQPPSMAMALLARNDSQRSTDNVHNQLHTLLQQATSAHQELEERLQIQRQLRMQSHPFSLVHPNLTQSLVSSSLLSSSLGVDELFPQSNAGQVLPNSFNLGTSPLYPPYQQSHPSWRGRSTATNKQLSL